MSAWERLSPELRQITDHHYTYPYSDGIDYPNEIYRDRKSDTEDTYDDYTDDCDVDMAGKEAGNYFIDDKPVYEVALKMSRNEFLTDADMLPIRDRINETYPDHNDIRDGGCRLLEFAVQQYKLQAIDMLFKYGADPYQPYDMGDDHVHVRDFYFRMFVTFHRGFSADVVRLYAKYGYDPNYVGVVGKQRNESFLLQMIDAHYEPAWVALMETGGDPWHKVIIVNESASVAASAAMTGYFPFLDYMLKYDYFTPDIAPEEINLVVEYLAKYYRPKADLGTTNRQRLIAAILEKTRLSAPTAEVQDYLNYRPAVTCPGYGSSPIFD